MFGAKVVAKGVGKLVLQDVAMEYCGQGGQVDGCIVLDT